MLYTFICIAIAIVAGFVAGNTENKRTLQWAFVVCIVSLVLAYGFAGHTEDLAMGIAMAVPLGNSEMRKRLQRAIARTEGDPIGDTLDFFSQEGDLDILLDEAYGGEADPQRDSARQRGKKVTAFLKKAAKKAGQVAPMVALLLVTLAGCGTSGLAVTCMSNGPTVLYEGGVSTMTTTSQLGLQIELATRVADGRLRRSEAQRLLAECDQDAKPLWARSSY